MTIYKIDWIEQKPTKEGKSKAEATLQDGATSQKVTIWGDFPGYAELLNGGNIEGTIIPSKDPRYLPSLKPETTGYRASRPQSGAMDAAKRTATSVKEAMDRKEDAVKIAATQRDAVLCAVAEYEAERRISSTCPSLEKYYDKWRQYFWEHYSVSDTDFPPRI